MLDREKMAEIIGLIHNNTAITEEEISLNLGITLQETNQIIDALID